MSTSVNDDTNKKHISPLELSLFEIGAGVGGVVIGVASTKLLNYNIQEQKLIKNAYNQYNFNSVKIISQTLYHRAKSQKKSMEKQILTNLQKQVKNLTNENIPKKSNQLLINTSNRIKYAKENFYFGDQSAYKDSISNIFKETFISVQTAEIGIQNELNTLKKNNLAISGVTLAVLGVLTYTVISKFRNFYKQNK